MAKKQKALQIWKFSTSQVMLLQEQARIHMDEFIPFRAYQTRAQNELLNSFRGELKIPQGIPLDVDLETLQFTERRDNVVPMVPKSDDEKAS